MSETTIQTRSAGYKVGWWILIGISLCSALGHTAFIFLAPNESLFIIWAAFNLVSVVVLYIPYRRGEKWAWYLVWIMIIPPATVILHDAEIGPYYLAAAGLMVVGQVLTRRAFIEKQ